ncbi:hypothetical protein HBI56_134670 [Parastagonospora nodorum]|uniref:Uncharacterized protein n=1 Tax=Phaeosphaeria nodorum (strain SN15 / ATCC MYA-4574 / FGSC 10173) TaxID=321614 RepID=A0A7U2F708_PHANO|nr:hypothetical protein HBH56_037770 [Parastagonospora nodorum]QRC99917.1 hypothetical protein JI435_414270 [Parastagonospora nodorum SN15]KAH3933650.1 hypothetical protein HBH54_061690 [Parastagonospora nodorum]KAH3952329.1 hypothetical protein HBH53_048420 [Parastagonospora nodorum]KAH4001797.1 hypothetical protein HBI10_078660 [Parastagonospora nodorum]
MARLQTFVLYPLPSGSVLLSALDDSNLLFIFASGVCMCGRRAQRMYISRGCAVLFKEMGNTVS